MDKLLKVCISWLYCLLFLLVPLILSPYTSEIFEFNKITLTYTLTIIIAAFWIARMIFAKKIIFQQTILDIPLVMFLASQIISTIFSIDFYTSVFGYYSRFNGGLLSIVSYSLLYWAFVSNMDKGGVKKIIISILASSVVVSFWGIFEHFGKSVSCYIFTNQFDVGCWVQDIKTRIFASFGQPNWLATWLAAIIPISLALCLKFPKNLLLRVLYYLLPPIFFVTLLYTKSRSGLIGLAVADLVFWLGAIWIDIEGKIESVIKMFIASHVVFGVIVLIIGTPWTPSIYKIKSPIDENIQQVGTVLETGGTESGDIRKIVWKGAIDIWKHYPIFGSGVETFAYTYYNFRSVEHNLVSEWDFLYNKAHNEYLNYLATTGITGFATYLAFTIFIVIQILKRLSSNRETKLIQMAFLSGSLAIIISNSFGFSVVPTQLLLFLLPAAAVAANIEYINGVTSRSSFTGSQKILIFSLLFGTGYLLIAVYRYYRADLFYNQGKIENQLGYYQSAIKPLEEAIILESHNAFYYDELARSYVKLAVQSADTTNTELTSAYTNSAIGYMAKAKSLSYYDMSMRRNRINRLTSLSQIDESFLGNAEKEILETLPLASNDPKLRYYYALNQLNLGKTDRAVDLLRETLVLKPDYVDARYQLATILIATKKLDQARKELEYLAKLSPDDPLIKDKLRSLE